jgi:GST-like protein
MIDLHYVGTPNGHKISIALEEMSLPYRKITYNILDGEHLTEGFRRISPNNRLPAIVDSSPIDGKEPFAVFETGAILLYLAEKTGTLLGKDARRRSLAAQWLMWQMAGLGPMHGQAHHFVRYAPEQLLYPIERYMNEARRLLHVLDRRLGEAEYLAEDYSIADIACWPWLRAIGLIGIDISDFLNIKRWWDVIALRPAVVAGIGTSDVNAPNSYGSARMTLTPAQWSNLFGDRMLAASRQS